MQIITPSTAIQVVPQPAKPIRQVKIERRQVERERTRQRRVARLTKELERKP